ncbi:hypothetical protein Golomagni_03207 [Golovinomyces magnicellulatus]|nr:hypothetical protein Golomagni_03207 [Golovinomyces magnicellulatus]
MVVCLHLLTGDYPNTHMWDDGEQKSIKMAAGLVGKEKIEFRLSPTHPPKKQRQRRRKSKEKKN